MQEIWDAESAEIDCGNSLIEATCQVTIPRRKHSELVQVDLGSILSVITGLVEPLRSLLRRPRIEIEIKKANWSKLKEGTDDSSHAPTWKETQVKIELRLLNRGEKTTVMDAVLDVNDESTNWPSLVPMRVKPGVFGTLGGGDSSLYCWYDAKESCEPLPTLLPHEPVKVDLSFVIPACVGGAELKCRLRLIDSYKKTWQCALLTREESPEQ